MKIFHTVESYIATSLLVLMGLVLISGASRANAADTEPLAIFEICFLVLSLSTGYFLIKKHRLDQVST